MSSVVGPLWTGGGSKRFAGRFPLAVESQAMANVAQLLPGITTVTPHARYYALHTAVFARAHELDLDYSATTRLLRRAEVVVGAVSILHGQSDPDAHAGLRSPHGSDHLSSRLAGGADVDALSADGAYAKAERGFWGPYVGSEFTMGLLATEGKRTVEGRNADRAALNEGFAGLFDLAARSVLSTDELVAAQHLCMCQARTSADGQMMRRILVPRSSTAMHDDDRRSQTLRMLLRLTDLTPTGGWVSRELVFGPARDDDVLNEFDVTPAWTGVVLRTLTVTAWRNLWRHLVEMIEGFMSIDALGEALASTLPAGSVRAFMDSRPPGMDGTGLVGSEFSAQIEALAPAERWLSWLMIGASRFGRLNERTGVYFQSVGTQTYLKHTSRDERFQQLTPSWLLDRLNEQADRPLRDFAVWLTHQLVERTERIAQRKASFTPNGVLRIPARVYVRDGYVFKDSAEAGGGVALRWESALEVMSGVGWVARVDGQWTLTDAGRSV